MAGWFLLFGIACIHCICSECCFRGRRGAGSYASARSLTASRGRCCGAIDQYGSQLRVLYPPFFPKYPLACRPALRAASSSCGVGRVVATSAIGASLSQSSPWSVSNQQFAACLASSEGNRDCPASRKYRVAAGRRNAGRLRVRLYGRFNRFYHRLGLNKQEIVATRAANDVLLHLVKVVLYVNYGMLDRATLTAGVAMMVIAGNQIVTKDRIGVHYSWESSEIKMAFYWRQHRVALELEKPFEIEVRHAVKLKNGTSPNSEAVQQTSYNILHVSAFNGIYITHANSPDT